MQPCELTDCSRPELEQVDDANRNGNPPKRQIDAANRPADSPRCPKPQRFSESAYLSTGHALGGEHVDPHAPQRTSVYSAVSLADSQTGKGDLRSSMHSRIDPRSSMHSKIDARSSIHSKISGWSGVSIEKSVGKPVSAVAPASALADMVAMELQEAQQMLAKSHRHVLQLLNSKSNMSSSAQPPPSSPSIHLSPANTDDRGQHHVTRTGGSILALASRIIGKRRSTTRRTHAAEWKPKPVDHGSEGPSFPLSTDWNRQVSRFELFPCWQGAYEPAVVKAVRSGKIGRALKKSIDTRNSSSHTLTSVPSFRSRVSQGVVSVEEMVLNPLSLRRTVWDVLSLTFVAYDILFLPLQFFDLTQYKFIVLFMGWLTRIFWTFDVPISFFTGYLLQDGLIMVNLYQIIRHYLTGWFLLDLIMVGSDWAELVVRASGEQVGRTVHILQMTRLMRIARMRGIFKVFQFRITSEKFTVIADMSKILCFVITVAHLIACFWYGICNAGDEREKSWIFTHQVQDSSLAYRYMMAMHWSLSQFQGGMDEVGPHNLNTRIFNVFAFLTSFMVAAVCVSELTSSMTRLDILASDRSRQLSVLRKYLAQNYISDKLALRVQRNALHAIYEQERLMGEHKVELLAVISDQLREELHFEMYSPVLEVHPFFDEYAQASPRVVQQICHRAVRTWLVSKGDTVFNTGEIPEFPQMYIICNGAFTYVQGHREMADLSAEDFISENPLWMPWMHRGALHSIMDGRLCAIDARTFQHIACHSEHTEFDPKMYAQEFIRKLNACQDEGIEISDLPLPQEVLAKEGGERFAAKCSSRSWISTSVIGDESEQQMERHASKKKQKNNPFLGERRSSSSSLEDSAGVQAIKSTKRTPRHSILMVTRASTRQSPSSSTRIIPEF